MPTEHLSLNHDLGILGVGVGVVMLALHFFKVNCHYPL
jgi:hypothetical protein